MLEYRFTGKYFDEFEIGQEFTSVTRTITEADIVNFAGISGDYNLLHTDEEFCKGTIFGERIAHGVLGLSIATGLLFRLGVLDGTTKAFVDMNWKFKGVIKIGDTIYARMLVSEKKESKSNPDQGTVTFGVSVHNQRDEIVQDGQWVMLMARK